MDKESSNTLFYLIMFTSVQSNGSHGAAYPVNVRVNQSHIVIANNHIAEGWKSFFYPLHLDLVWQVVAQVLQLCVGGCARNQQAVTISCRGKVVNSPVVLQYWMAKLDILFFLNFDASQDWKCLLYITKSRKGKYFTIIQLKLKITHKSDDKNISKYNNMCLKQRCDK